MVAAVIKDSSFFAFVFIENDQQLPVSNFNLKLWMKATWLMHNSLTFFSSIIRLII